MQNKISILESEQVRRSKTKSLLESEIKIVDSELNKSLEEEIENGNPFTLCLETSNANENKSENKNKPEEYLSNNEKSMGLKEVILLVNMKF